MLRAGAYSIADYATCSSKMASGDSSRSNLDNQQNTTKYLVLFKETVQSFTEITKDEPGQIIEECQIIVQWLEDEKHEIVVEKHNIKVL